MGDGAQGPVQAEHIAQKSSLIPEGPGGHSLHLLTPADPSGSPSVPLVLHSWFYVGFSSQSYKVMYSLQMCIFTAS